MSKRPTLLKIGMLIGFAGARSRNFRRESAHAKMFTRTSPWAAFIACTLAWSVTTRAQQTTVAHVFLTFDGASDNCTECGQQEFACSYDSPFQSGNWNGGVRNFSDPMPVCQLLACSSCARCF